jgi:small subunit ribosomal protein S21
VRGNKDDPESPASLTNGTKERNTQKRRGGGCGSWCKDDATNPDLTLEPGGAIISVLLEINEKGGKHVSRVVIREGESFEGALKRFKKKVQTDRVLSEVRRRRFFEKPSVIRKRKKATKLRKSRRQTRKSERQRY